jgi:hypothetical protein
MTYLSDYREFALEVAEEVVDSFAGLYPGLSMPLNAWETLREMIEREILFHHNSELVPDGARGVAKQKLYIEKAIASGLRNVPPPTGD